jgi:hypothetical protein
MLYVSSSKNKVVSSKKDYREQCEKEQVDNILYCNHPFDCKYAMNITPDGEIGCNTRITCGKALAAFMIKTE